MFVEKDNSYLSYYDNKTPKRKNSTYSSTTLESNDSFEDSF
jgi:hypothetical protein